jgi:hypothetical protein
VQEKEKQLNEMTNKYHVTEAKLAKLSQMQVPGQELKSRNDAH